MFMNLIRHLGSLHQRLQQSYLKAMTTSIESMLQLLQQLILFHLGYVDHDHECPAAAKETQLVLSWHHAAWRKLPSSRPLQAHLKCSICWSRIIFTLSVLDADLSTPVRSVASFIAVIQSEKTLLIHLGF